MSHTKREKAQLNELFTTINKHRYHSSWKLIGHKIKTIYRHQKQLIVKSFK